LSELPLADGLDCLRSHWLMSLILWTSILQMSLIVWTTIVRWVWFSELPLADESDCLNSYWLMSLIVWIPIGWWAWLSELLHCKKRLAIFPSTRDANNQTPTGR
jgi:hypothetical protein